MTKKVEDIFNWYNLSKYRNVIYGFSAIWIIALHITNFFPEITKDFHPFLIQLAHTGNVGVDIFLIMSGICLYFSLKKTNGKKILQFYKRRFTKLLKIYLLICIPWGIFYTIYSGQDLQFFINTVTIIGRRGGQFWFISFIAICYLVYPLLYKIIENKKTYLITLFIPIYFVFLCLLNIFFKDFYASYEIAIARPIPFLVGVLLSKNVYEKRTIKQSTMLTSFTLLFIRDALLKALQMKNILFISAISRTYSTILALSAVFFIIIFFELFKLPRTQQSLESTGKISLEVYIIHMILSEVIISILHLPINNTSQLILFTVAFTLLSIIVAKIIHKVLDLIPPRPPKHPVSSPSSPPL